MSKKFLYDLEIIVPISSSNQYKQRFEDFKKYGLFNNKHKLILKLLIGPHDSFDNFDFKENIEVKIVKSNYISAVQKICEYYLSMSEEDLNKTRWFAKFDDDSITDVSGLINNLDLEFDHKKEFYLVTGLYPMLPEFHGIEMNLLKEFGYERWFKHGSLPVFNEWEGCVVSQKAMKKMILNPKSKAFFKRRLDYSLGPGDVVLACTARMQKIYPIDVSFLSKEPDIRYFSIFGGVINHIHFISHDNNFYLFEMFKNLIDNKYLEKKIIKGITDVQFAFWRNNQEFICLLKPNKYGFLEAHHNNESFWEFKDNKLYFLDQDFRPTAIFDEFDENFEQLNGHYVPEPHIKYALTSSLKPPIIKKLSLL